jgi:hypothetical protein
MNKEDAWPIWLSKVIFDNMPATMPDPKVRTWVAEADEREWGLKDRFTVRVEVCEDCNHGWMSTLETAVSGFIGPMILGNPTTLVAEQQRLLSYWATKTAFVHTLSQHKKLIPRADFATVYSHRESRRPPAHVRVYVGAYDATTSWGVNGVCWRWGGSGKAIPDDEEDGMTLGVYSCTFAVGHLAFQVMGHPGWIGSRKIPDRNPAGIDARLWPSRTPLVPWPPPVAMTDAVMVIYSRATLNQLMGKPLLEGL